jgi:starvation-inducible DNA-binding protein
VHPSPSVLPETERQTICAALAALLLDGIDLQCMAKVAHWNARGPLFLELHRLFGKISAALVEHNDNVAERIVTLGGEAVGTCRMVGLGTRLEDYIGGTEPLLDRMHMFLKLAHASRDDMKDLDTQDLLTQMIREIEKYAWQLLATVQR